VRKGGKKMDEIRRSILVIGQLLGAILGEDFATPVSQTMYDYPNERYIV